MFVVGALTDVDVVTTDLDKPVDRFGLVDE